MQIQSVTPIPLTAPYLRPGGTDSVRNCVWLRVVTCDGLTGWGEAYCGCYATEVTVAALRRLCAGLAGRDLPDPAAVLADVRFRNRYWAMRGIGAQATSALETALWDIAAQAAGKPLWAMLTDGPPHPVLLYASMGEDRRSPREIFDEVTGYVADGYQAYKLRCGGTRLDDYQDRLAVDTERVAAARQALGPEKLLFVDVHVPQRPVTWDRSRAEAYMRALAPFGVVYIEEPALTYDVEGYRELQRLQIISVAGGESFCAPDEFEPFFAGGALGVAQPDAAVVGGPVSCRAVCRRAAECGVPVSLHAWSAGAGIAQNLHVGWSSEGILAMEWPLTRHALASDPIAGISRFEAGYMLPPEAPGLGIQVDAEWLERFALQPGSERDY